MPRAIKQEVDNRGAAPDSFLREVVAWAKGAPDEIFAPNPSKVDAYAYASALLGPWDKADMLGHRRAVMCELMRAHAGLESSWNWKEAVDKSNATSMRDRDGEETGIFQVSFNSIYLNKAAMKAFAESHGIGTAPSFISKMKILHALALEYYARLIRVNVEWAGPYRFHKLDRWLSRDAVAEFRELLA